MIAACSSGGAPGAARTACPGPTPAGDVALLPKDLGLSRHGILTRTQVQGGYLGARIVSETQIVELYPPLARGLVDEGYRIVGADNEGFEAEIYFVRGKEVTGAYRLREGPCQGQVTINLLYGSPRYEKKGEQP